MGQIWNGTLEVVNQERGGFVASAQAGALSMWSLGGGANVENYSRDYEQPYNCYGPPQQHTSTGQLEDWWGYYEPFIISVSAPDDSDTVQVYLWVTDEFRGAPGPPFLPDGAIVVGPDLAVDVSMTVSGLYLRRSRVTSKPDDRQLMDWNDQRAIDLWYADDASTVTVTATGPGGISLSATGSLGYTPGQEVEIGTSYILSTGIMLNYAKTANVVYARISNLCWGNTPVNLSNLDLYRPGDGAGIPSADISPWSRIQSTTDCYHVFNNGGIAMEHLHGSEYSQSCSPKLSAPNILTLTAVDSMYDAAGPDYAPNIEYESPVIQWSNVGGSWVSSYVPFTKTLSASEFPSNWEFEYEYSKIANTPVFVRVTEGWRNANGEDVGNDVPGGDGEQYNDQRAPIMLQPIDKSVCTGDPWWPSGVSVVHLDRVTVNDTMGLPQRPTWWVEGGGLTVDPLDNDIWTVPALSSAPYVYRNLWTRYWLRVGRLNEHLDDPEREHLADWGIMLKANLPITQTLDDPNWWLEPVVEVRGAGSSVNGDYGIWGSCKGQTQYRDGTGLYIRWDGTQWTITDGSTVYYTCATLTGTWVVAGGQSPAPTVTLVQYEDYGEVAQEFEDITNWANYAYIEMQLDAPRGGIVRLEVDYWVPQIYDPCYTSFRAEFGNYFEGEYEAWTLTRTAHTLTYDIEVSAGLGTYLIDLVSNREGVIPVDSERIQVVSKLTLRLPGNDGDVDEQWELTGLDLVKDTGEPGRPEPDEHLAVRYKPSWSWIDPNWRDTSEGSEHAPEDWFGFGGVNDGLSCLQVDCGYNASFGRTAKEKGLLYIQFRQHDPDYEGPNVRLDYAKALGRWYAELNWQEGFEVTWPSPGPEASIYNQDSNGGMVDGMYWWDLRHSDETLDLTDVPVALCAGTWAMAAGVPYEMRFYKYPRGKIHGLLVDAMGLRMRGVSGAVNMYGAETGYRYQLVAQLDTDAHGRFKSPPVRERDWTYWLAAY